MCCANMGFEADAHYRVQNPSVIKVLSFCFSRPGVIVIHGTRQMVN